jgi:hypothetical protein
VLQFPRRRDEAKEVSLHKSRLQHKLGVLVLWFAPAADVDVKFPMVFLIRRIIPRKDAKDHGRVKAGDIFDSKRIGAIAEALRQVYL